MPNRTEIWYQDQFGRWHHYQTKFNAPDAYRTASKRAETTGRRHKITDQEGNLLDLITP